jgi:hypothetical protein
MYGATIKMNTQFSLVDLGESGHLEDLGVDGG